MSGGNTNRLHSRTDRILTDDSSGAQLPVSVSSLSETQVTREVLGLLYILYLKVVVGFFKVRQ